MTALEGRHVVGFANEVAGLAPKSRVISGEHFQTIPVESLTPEVLPCAVIIDNTNLHRGNMAITVVQTTRENMAAALKDNLPPDGDLLLNMSLIVDTETGDLLGLEDGDSSLVLGVGRTDRGFGVTTSDRLEYSPVDENPELAKLTDGSHVISAPSDGTYRFEEGTGWVLKTDRDQFFSETFAQIPADELPNCGPQEINWFDLAKAYLFGEGPDGTPLNLTAEMIHERGILLPTSDQG